MMTTRDDLEVILSYYFKVEANDRRFTYIESVVFSLVNKISGTLKSCILTGKNQVPTLIILGKTWVVRPKSGQSTINRIFVTLTTHIFSLVQ